MWIAGNQYSDPGKKSGLSQQDSPSRYARQKNEAPRRKRMGYPKNSLTTDS